ARPMPKWKRSSALAMPGARSRRRLGARHPRALWVRCPACRTDQCNRLADTRPPSQRARDQPHSRAVVSLVNAPIAHQHRRRNARRASAASVRRVTRLPLYGVDIVVGGHRRGLHKNHGVRADTIELVFLRIAVLPRAPRKFFHAVRDNTRQLQYLLAQFGVFHNVALNAIAIGLQFSPERLKLTEETINFAHRSL